MQLVQKSFNLVLFSIQQTKAIKDENICRTIYYPIALVHHIALLVYYNPKHVMCITIITTDAEYSLNSKSSIHTFYSYYSL